ncbi:DNA repair protein RecO [Gammaproteobacteria bacterium 42_54_T18]|nr:DNA repair protein RecO [Gammaproteobacteria bacterium 42_54_T18]
MNSVENALCYVLHSKPFKDTSAIVELLSQEYGLVSVIFKGVRSTKNSAKSRVLQPFQPLLASWYGKRELKSGKSVEQGGVPHMLSGKKLYSGIYLNEILLRMLHRDAPAEGIYEHYQQCLSELVDTDNIEVYLRQFEWRLLDAIGYQLPCECDAQSGAPIVVDAYYRYEINHGFIYDSPISSKNFAPRSGVFSGELLLAISRDMVVYAQQQQYHDNLSRHLLPEAKRLMRLVLAPHLGGKPLESKKLFMGISKYESSQ